MQITAVTSPGRTRGCSEVGGTKMVVQIAPPSKFSHRKLARIYEHELQHSLGKEHEAMTDRQYWSKGGDPNWAVGARLRYKGPAGKK